MAVTESRTLTLRLSSSKPLSSQPIGLSFKSCFGDFNTKDNFEEIVNREVSHPKETPEKHNTYVHPMLKRSSSWLSEKSLQICTENLGNETGTDLMMENNIDSFSSVGGNFPTRKQPIRRQNLGAKKAEVKSFPPPLTTMRGSEYLRVRPHREDGRLIIKAVKVASSVTCFQAERSHGRLRLCILKNSTADFDSLEKEFETGILAQRREEGCDEAEAIGEEEEERNTGYVGEEMNGNRCNVGEDMGMEKYERRARRCKEGSEKENNGLLNWEPPWVATS